jgi:AraC-like DNA-binding protein/ligand-binding sensor protein
LALRYRPNYFYYRTNQDADIEKMDTVADVQGTLCSLAATLGLSVVWKNRDGRSLVGLPRELRAHMAPYCREVKSRREGLRKCVHDDTVDCFTRLNDGKPVLRTCHAGVVDLIVPGIAEGSMEGCLFVGSCRLRESRCGVGEYATQYRALTLTAADTLRRSVPLLRLVAASIAEYARRVRTAALPAAVAHPAIATALRFIDEHLAERLDIDTVAHACCMSRSRFTALFRHETGSSLSHYLQARRVAEAKRLLATTPLDLRAVAFATGFFSQSYFCTVFRRRTGTTPHAYARNVAGQREP